MRKTITAVVFICAPAFAFAQASTQKMMELKDAIKKQDYSALPSDVRRSVETGTSGAQAIAERALNKESPLSANMVEMADNWQRISREAIVAAYPPRDKARAKSIFLDGGVDPDSRGKLYYFVSRSMPMNLLRAYALDAFYTGGTLVVKGIRKGDTIKEYVEEALADYNSADSQMLSGLEINPNLYDMFNVQVVPTIVWTNRAWLDENGSGCVKPEPGPTAPQIALETYDGSMTTVDKPVCLEATPASYYKIAGAVTTTYALDRFIDAGAPKDKIDGYKAKLSKRSESVYQQSSQAIGNAMPGVARSIKLDSYPVELLQYWDTELKTKNVQKSAFGPKFDNTVEDDKAYREELTRKIRQGLD